MTQANTHIPNRNFIVSDTIVATLTAATIVLAGFLSLIQFAVVV